MQNDRNMTNCTLLLHQQTNLQHDLEKYMLVEDNILKHNNYAKTTPTERTRKHYRTL